MTRSSSINSNAAPAIWCVVLLVAAMGCGFADSAAPEATSVVAEPGVEQLAGPLSIEEPAGIYNLLQVSERIFSGSEPHGEQGLASLARLGVKTVVSVDGAKPNVEAARRHGLRYVHIPIGYDGVSEEAGHSLARLIREAEGPYYIHCHHGRHRGPAAVAVACIAAGDMDNIEALQVLVSAGTSKDYPGLWRDVENYVPPPADANLPELVEVAAVDSFTAAMAQVDRSYDNLKLCRDSAWSVPPGHPDIEPAQEALLLQEGLYESIRNLYDAYDETFEMWLKEAEALATELRRDLQKKDLNAASRRFILIEKSCMQCHQAYRD